MKLLKRQIVETISEGKEVFQELKDDMQDTLLIGNKIFLKTSAILRKKFWTSKVN